jgi:hypothetical protein
LHNIFLAIPDLASGVPEKGLVMPAKKSAKIAAAPPIDLAQWNNFDALPPVGDGPARGIVRKTPYRIVGGLDVPGRTVYPAEWESYLERASISTLLLCQDIESFATQPQELIYQLQDLPRSCFPDLFVTGDFGTAYVEVKPLEILVRDENIERYIEVARRLRAAGRAIFFFIDADILVKPRVQTVMFLNRYARTVISTEELTMMRQVVNKKILPLKQLQTEAGLTLRHNDISPWIGQHRWVPTRMCGCPPNPYRSYLLAPFSLRVNSVIFWRNSLWVIDRRINASWRLRRLVDNESVVLRDYQWWAIFRTEKPEVVSTSLSMYFETMAVSQLRRMEQNLREQIRGGP